MTIQDVQDHPDRYLVRGWTVGRDYARWSDRPRGEPAYLVVDDLLTQTTHHLRGVPEDYPQWGPA